MLSGDDVSQQLDNVSVLQSRLVPRRATEDWFSAVAISAEIDAVAYVRKFEGA